MPGGLTEAHKEFNKMFNTARQRVEHIIGQIKRRALYRQPFRGTLRNAVTYTHIIVHAVNTHIRLRGGNYDGYGFWSHFPRSQE